MKKDDIFDFESDLNEDVNLYDEIPGFESEKDKIQNISSSLKEEKKGKGDSSPKTKNSKEKVHIDSKEQSHSIIRIQSFIDEQMYIQMKIYLIRNRMSVTSFINGLLKDFFEGHEKK